MKKTITNRFSRIVTRQAGFTLTELLAVMAILGILAGLVSGAVGGVGSSGQKARLAGDRVTIGTAVDRFFNLSFPQSYPVVRFEEHDASLAIAGDLGVRIIDFDARLPQDPDQTFTPNFLKQIPDSSAFVSWRMDTARGILFFAREGAQIIPPAESRVDVTATHSTNPGDVSGYSFKLITKKNEAAVTILSIEIPGGYSIGGQELESGVALGTLVGSFDGDNPWDPGHTVNFTGAVRATGVPNEWELTIDYPTIVNSPAQAVVQGRPDKTHTITIIEPSVDIPGKVTMHFDRTGEATEHNEVRETWLISVFDRAGVAGSPPLITNPSSIGVYRWLTEEATVIDLPDTFDNVPGKKSIIIK